MVGFYVTRYDDGNPKRRSDFYLVKKELQRQGVNFEVVNDTVGRGPWWTARQAWLRGLLKKWDHVFVLQDDMLPACTNFLAATQNAAEAVGSSAIMSFFSMRRMTKEAHDQGSAWCSTPDGSWGGSIMMSRSLVEQFLRWQPGNIRSNYPWDDRRVSFFAIANNVPIFVSSQQILQHIGAAHSSLGNSNRMRVASNLFTGDGADIDWTAGLPSPPRFSGTIPKAKMQEALIDR
jgi:hypothetical protein